MDKSQAGGNPDAPVFSGNSGNSEVGMKTNRNRHATFAEIGDGNADLQPAVRNAVRHFVLVCKWPLRHQIGESPELQAAGNGRFIPGNNLPQS